MDEYARESAAASKQCAAQDYAACRQHLLHLNQLLDGRADILYRLAKVEAALGHRQAALGYLTVFSKSGLTFAHLATDPGLEALRPYPEFEAAVSRIEAARKPVSSSTRLFQLPRRDLIPEDIAFDPPTGRFFVSSVRHGLIVAISTDGIAANFTKEGTPDVWAILALAADPPRRILWATTAAMPESLAFKASDAGRSALLKYSLDTARLIARFDVTDAGKHALGDMTLSLAGVPYVSDGYGAVYTLNLALRKLELVAGKGVFRSPQTPVLSPDGTRLLVPDYSRGISALDLRTKTATLIAHPPELSLAGIDGLYLAGSTLIAIQNGVEPPRLIAMRIDPALTSISSWKILEANSAGLGQPTHGVVAGGDFFFIADSGWDRLDGGGKLKPGLEFSHPAIRRMPMSAAISGH